MSDSSATDPEKHDHYGLQRGGQQQDGEGTPQRPQAVAAGAQRGVDLVGAVMRVRHQDVLEPVHELAAAVLVSMPVPVTMPGRHRVRVGARRHPPPARRA